jgi:hypothetical protein
MKNILKALLIISLSILATDSAIAQRKKDKGQSPRQAAKEQAQLKKERKQKVDKEMEDKKKSHHDIQDKATKRRMKRSLRKSQKLNRNRPEPFYKRWFRKRRIRK